jgi:hypothetical protein
VLLQLYPSCIEQPAYSEAGRCEFSFFLPPLLSFFLPSSKWDLSSVKLLAQMEGPTRYLW